MTVTDVQTLARTRRTLHGVAEQLLAATTRRATGRIRLMISDASLGTPSLPGPVTRLQVRADATLVRHPEGLVVPLEGSFGELADRLGIEFGMPDPPYQLASGVEPGDTVDVDRAALETLLDALVVGDGALRAFSTQEEPVVWPEHLDVGITVDEVNYGVSPGDGYLGEPYAYVGPHTARTGAFFNAPFGAARPLRSLASDAVALPDAVRAFFEQGRAETSP